LSANRRGSPVVTRDVRRIVVLLVVAAVAVACNEGADTTGEPTTPRATTPSTTVELAAPPGWSRILKADAGIAPGASPDAVVSDGERALLVGAEYPPEAPPVGAIWWTDDGRSWHDADVPDTDGPIYTAGIDGDVALASGRTGNALDDDVRPFLWRSEDGGETWTDTALPADELGPPAPEMGRPDITQLVHHDGWWVAAGGSSTGYAGVWISETGEDWQQVIESEESGGFGLAELDGERTMAWAGDQAWVTDDPTAWGDPRPMGVPDEPGYLTSLSQGASWAVWEPADATHLDHDLLHSDDEGRTWTKVDDFRARHPGAALFSAGSFGDLTVLAGFGPGSRPGAWASTDGTTWEGIPRALQEPPGGLLTYAAEVDGQVVIFGSAPELDRFYVYRP
jgi:hypothetical protein